MAVKAVALFLNGVACFSCLKVYEFKAASSIYSSVDGFLTAWHSDACRVQSEFTI